VVAEFTELQPFADFLIEKTRRQVEGELILSKSKREDGIKSKWYCIGMCVGACIVHIVQYLLK